MLRLRMKPGPSLSVKCAELTLPIKGALRDAEIAVEDFLREIN